MAGNGWFLFLDVILGPDCSGGSSYFDVDADTIPVSFARLAARLLRDVFVLSSPSNVM